MKLDIEDEIRIVKWAVIVVVILVVYALPFAALPVIDEASIMKFFKESFWTPDGQSKFLMTFVPIGLIFWFIDYMRVKMKYSVAWHFGTLVKVTLYVVMMFSVSASFIAPLTYLATVQEIIGYVETTIASEEGIQKIIVLVVLTAVVTIIIRLQAKEKPKDARDEY